MADGSLDIPFVAPRVLATMAETHVNLRLTPNEDPPLAFSMAVPKTWAYSRELGPVPSGPFATRALGLLTGSVEPGAPMVGVTVTQSPFEIPVDTWLTLSLGAEGWTVVSARWFPGPFGLFFDVVGTRVFQDVPEVRRTTAHVDGSNIFCVNSLTERKHWDAIKETFWVAHCTFELLGGTKLGRMEPWLSAKAQGLELEIAYPISWSAAPVPASTAQVSAIDVRLLDITQEKLLAYFQVRAERAAAGSPPPPLETLRNDAVDRLARSGFVATGALRPLLEDEDPRSVAVDGWLGGFVGKGRLGTSDLLMRLAFIQRKGVSFSLALASPALEDDTLVALRAQRAFEIARATIRLS